LYSGLGDWSSVSTKPIWKLQGVNPSSLSISFAPPKVVVAIFDAYYQASQ